MSKSMREALQEVRSKLVTSVETEAHKIRKIMNEGVMKDIYTMDKDGASAKEIAKRLRLPVETVKDILGEMVNELINHSRQLKDPSKETMVLDKKTGKVFVIDKDELRVWLRRGYIQAESVQEKKDDTGKDIDKIKLAKEKDTDALEKQIVTLQGQINLLKTQLENEKNQAMKPQPNPETGEIPLTIGVAYKHLKDKKEKEEKKEVKKEELEEGSYAYNKMFLKKRFKNVDSFYAKAKQAGMKTDKDIESYVLKHLNKDYLKPFGEEVELEEEEERTYTVIHVKKGKEIVKAKTTYAAAVKYAQMKGLKDTAGVSVYLMTEEVELKEKDEFHLFSNKKDAEKKAKEIGGKPCLLLAVL